jgi:hypothetical protein
LGRHDEETVLRLWFDWCKIWPVQYARNSLAVKEEGYDPVFDLIPSQAYKDFYYEVVRDHPTLKRLNPLEVIDITLNQIPAPERPIVVAEPAADAVVEQPEFDDLPDNVVPHRPVQRPSPPIKGKRHAQNKTSAQNKKNAQKKKHKGGKRKKHGKSKK